MIISRRGARADHGESSIELDEPVFSWDKAGSCVTLKRRYVKDFSTSSRHSYTVKLSLVEINDMLQALADAAISDPCQFEKALEPSLKSLLRLQAVAAGITTNES